MNAHELRDMPVGHELRTTRPADLAIEERDGEKPLAIVGYAAVFNSLSCDLGGFRERILPGAFRKSLELGDDVRALVNHDSSRIIGRSKAKTLTLREDEKGLKVRILPPDTTAGRDIVESIRRGDVDGMSFGFDCLEDAWHVEGGQNVRDVREAKLWDVSPVTYPAYQETTVGLRSAIRAAGIDLDAMARVLCRAERKLPLSQLDETILREIVSRMQALIPGTPRRDERGPVLERLKAGVQKA